jgi:hypothetical protein
MHRLFDNVTCGQNAKPYVSACRFILTIIKNIKYYPQFLYRNILCKIKGRVFEATNLFERYEYSQIPIPEKGIKQFYVE